jgi:regulator of sigma E protease
MITVLAFLVAIVLLVVIHEYGHYWVARRCGVKVLRFSVGFGPVLYARRSGGTEWALSAIPLGGYVKMLDEREGPVAEHELPLAFNRQPVLQRMAIVIAGPVANLLLAIILYWGLFMHGVPGLKPMLGDIPPNTPAATAQLQPQETITSINGEAIPSWQEIRWVLLKLALQQGVIDIEGRTPQGQTLHHKLDLGVLAPADLDGDFLQKLGLQPYQPLVLPIIGKLTEGGAAQRGGLQLNDVIKSANGRPLTLWTQWVEEVRSHPGSTLQVEIVRDGHLVTLNLMPESVTEGGKAVGKIGAAPHIDKQIFDAQLTEVSYAPVAAIGMALRKTWETAAISLQMMVKMVFGEVSLKNLSGPITIADYAGQTAQMGIIAYIGFLALISISLGVLNLLPIPLLDGGHLLYYGVEWIKGSPVSERAWQVGQNAGIALLATMMVFALYNDINRLISG